MSGNITQLLLLFGFWIVVLVLLFLGLKSKSSYKYTDKELLLPQPKSEIPEFPKWYKYLHSFGIIFLLTFFIFWMFFFSMIVISNLQKFIYAGEKGISVFSAPYTWIISLAPSLFLGLVFAGFILKSISYFFPIFDQYQALKDKINLKTIGVSKEERKQIWQDALRQVDLQKVARAEWRQLLLGGLIIWLIAGPIYILAMDYYMKLKFDGLAVNSVFTLKEYHYKWQDIEKASVYTVTKKNSSGEPYLAPSFEIEIKDGKKFDIWKSAGWGSLTAGDLIKAAKLLSANGIFLELQPLTSEQENILSEFPQGIQTTIHSVFNEVEYLTK